MHPTLVATANPHFAAEAVAEIQQAAPGAHCLPPLAPGVWPVRLEQDFFDLAELWRQRPPIFVRHICPVQAVIPLTGTAGDVAVITHLVKTELLDLIDPELSFSVQTRTLSSAPYKPFDLNRALSDIVEANSGAPLDVRAPVQIVSVVIGKSVAYVGVSLAVHNLSNWAGGMHRFAREKDQISRAEFKLLEAIEVFHIELPPRGIILDLGAAPGGWTRVLRQKEQYVTAVDPANLHPSLQQDKNVRHLRLTAEAYLQQQPDSYDAIVNDMRQDARDSARLMAAYAPYLTGRGFGLITLKLPASNRGPAIDHALNILQQAYHVAGARQLFHNRREITVYLTSILLYR